MDIHSNYDAVAKKQLVGILPRRGVLHHFTQVVTIGVARIFNWGKLKFKKSYPTAETDPESFDDDDAKIITTISTIFSSSGSVVCLTDSSHM